MLQDDSIDEDVYHYDFTTASEWEIFIARLEEIIHDWKINVNNNSKPLRENELYLGSWSVKSEKALFSDVEFSITRYYLDAKEESDIETDAENDVLLENDCDNSKLQALEDMMSMNNDFIPVIYDGTVTRPHILARWYGLREFVVLTPLRSFSITSESKIKILLSSMCIAVNNSNCEVPVFVQVLEPWQHFYVGICEGRGIRAKFEMVHLKRIPPHCKHLTGLLNLFKSSLGISNTLQVDPVRIAARFAYTLRDWTSYVWSQEPPDFDFLQGEVGVADLGTLPFGATFDPVRELVLYAVWPDFLETVVVDSESYTDLEPNQAPHWFVSIKMVDQPVCLLSEYMSEFLHLCTVQQSMNALLGDLVQDTGPDLSASLNILTESRVPTISKVLQQGRGSKSKEKSSQGPISNDLLMPILYFLFPDADTVNEQPRSPYPETIGNTISREPNTAENLIGTGMKSAAVDCLVWRLAIVMAHAVHTLGGIKAAAHLWYEFCQELRYRWDNGLPIPGVPSGFPDSKTCLLNQKLQMLNCCIDRKNARDNAALNPDNQSDESDDDDEFFDCSMDEEGNSSEQDAEKPKPKHSLWNHPVGRLCRHGNLQLIKTKEYLYIPVTQEATPKTEDQLEEDAEVLLQLGTDALGTKLRSQLMSASLLSDMESFKAANPGSILEDFIRWYSPRDWIEDTETDENDDLKKGTLSARMQIPGNTWLEMWAAAKPVPARRQKRLFDDTREAEKVLHQLEAKKPSAAAQMLLGPLVHAVLLRLAQQTIPIEIPSLTLAIKHMVNKAEVLSRVQISDMTKYQEICGEVACAEAMVAQVASLEHKLCPGKGQTFEMREFLANLVSQPQAAVPGGPHSDIGNRIRGMFSEAHKVAQMICENDMPSEKSEPWSPLSTSVFPTATEKEFIMRANIPRPTSSSMVVSHRLTVRISKDDITMAGCFSQDTTFQ